VSVTPVHDAGRRLEGKVALVTGASSGIGAAVARRMSAAGAKVVLAARRRAQLDALARELGDGCLVAVTDVTDPVGVRTTVTEAASHFGGLDIVVNSAGVTAPAALADADPVNWQLHIDVNLSGSYYVAREAGLLMRAAGGGTIVNVGSDLSSTGAAMFVPYCAAKAGIIGLTRALAVELAPTVTVNAICPGPVDTPMLAAELELLGDGDAAAARAEMLSRVPLGRLATAAEVADGIFYLAVQAPFATGATLELDGGITTV
jgi:NAD(P)-dependent dehydrogenase (short-subunit alcohol dehydrogenase family)